MHLRRLFQICTNQSLIEGSDNYFIKNNINKLHFLYDFYKHEPYILDLIIIYFQDVIFTIRDIYNEKLR